MKKFVTSIILFTSHILFSQASFNMDLVGNLPYAQGTNDIWGYANGEHEYALVGTVTGFSVVDVSCPQYPNELFFIPGSSSTWRDVKTWGKYAYVTTEAADGLLIVDLSDLSGQTYIYTDEFFTTSHNIFIDENGYAYIFGADGNQEFSQGNISAGGAVILDLNQDPMNPTLVGIFDDYYLHDGMVRGDTLWGSAIYAGVFSIVDVADKSNPTIMSSYPTSCQFTHNAWISDDNNFLFTTDETAGCYVGSYDVSDIYDIQEIDLIQEWTGDGANGEQENVIPHNTHVLGDFLVTSYYTSGVTIIDSSNPFNLVEVGYYDTSPMTGGNFDGCWGAYPYLPSGLILATDQQEGLFILHSSHITHDDLTDIVDTECVGCTDETALNYNPAALDDNGTCLYIYGCTDEEALNYNLSATDDDGSCEYYCDNFSVASPVCDAAVVASGEDGIINCEGEFVTFLDLDGNILEFGSTYNAGPINEDTSFLVFAEEVVETNITNTGEPYHEGFGENADYSADVYNGGLLFNCYSNFTLNSVKVYTDIGGERTIELKDNAGNLIYDLIVNVPQSNSEGYIIDLGGWEINPGMQYLLTTNIQMNNANFGYNNPRLKRTTGGLPNFPFIINNVLEITEGYYTQGGDNFGSSADYYYYFYDWGVEFNGVCSSELNTVTIVVDNSSYMQENLKSKSLMYSTDFLGRSVNDQNFILEIYNDGTVEKKITLK